MNTKCKGEQTTFLKMAIYAYMYIFKSMTEALMCTNCKIFHFANGHFIVYCIPPPPFASSFPPLPSPSASAGYVDVLLGYQATQYLANETEYVPWQAAITNLEYVDRMFVKSSGYGALKVRTF